MPRLPTTKLFGNWSFYSKNETAQLYFLKNKSENQSLKVLLGVNGCHDSSRQQTANLFQMILGLASTATICHKWAAKRATPYSTPTEKKTKKLVGGFKPSEKYESQLFTLFPIYGTIKHV